MNDASGGDDTGDGDTDDELVGPRILQNEELVRLILESAQNPSEPITAEQFIAWLAEVAGESSTGSPP